jgi:integrase
VHEHDDGLAVDPADLTVSQVVEDWLRCGLAERSGKTKDKCTILCRTHVIPAIGAHKIRNLSATDIDEWLKDKAKTLSTNTLQILHQCLNRAVKQAMARDLIKRNVVELCGVPKGQPGRPSKSLTLEQAVALLEAAEDTSMHAYVVVSLLTGARTEELRALRWEHVDLDGKPDADPPVPPSITVWHSVWEHRDTKAKKSQRTLALPAQCVLALVAHRERRGPARLSALVFATAMGTEMQPATVRRAFRQAVKAAGLDPTAWTTRELRHSFLSPLSDEVALAMDRIFPVENTKTTGHAAR